MKDRNAVESDIRTLPPPTRATLKISGVVDGMATALLKMRAGDHWMVYIPFTLGYGKTQKSGSSIPAYSNLIFDVRMVDICR